MNGDVRLSVAGLLVLAGLLSTGCNSTFRSETTLRDDGGVERAIYQPLGQTPAAAQRPALWTLVTYAPDPDGLEKQGMLGPIAGLPLRAAGQDTTYFAAWGKFKSIEDLPEHVLIAAPPKSGLADSKLERACTRNDYVFVVEHRWRETLTDVVRADDLRRARTELADLLIGVFADTFDEALGAEYDGTDLVQLLRKEGVPWLEEATDFLFLYCAAHKGADADKGLADGLADVCAHHGLVLKKEGAFLQDPALQEAFDAFVVDRVCGNVRNKKDGLRVERKVAAAWLKEWRESDPSKNRFARAYAKAIGRKFGSDEAYQQRLGVLLARIFGLHLPGALLGERHFDYTMKVPGLVVETNGQLLAEDRVRWQFGSRDPYPFGYDMTCRSLVVQEPLQKELLKGQPLEGREAALRFVTLMHDRNDLVEALRACRASKKMTPLYAYREKASRGANAVAEVKRVNEVLKVLQLRLESEKE